MIVDGSFDCLVLEMNSEHSIAFRGLRYSLTNGFGDVMVSCLILVLEP